MTAIVDILVAIYFLILAQSIKPENKTLKWMCYWFSFMLLSVSYACVILSLL